MEIVGAFERVYTVNDYYDGPRSGFADCGGVPHAYRSLWRHDLDDWDPDDRFLLAPVTPEVLAIALEDWAIWLRWEDAYYAGRTTDATHPALPADQPRHAEIRPVIDQALEVDAARACIAVGEFRAKDRGPGEIRTPGRLAELEVRWIPASLS
ncbi:MAG TPA: hypothetical protein VE871_16095 [Longimicrobium sp.]|nr:hypothetical protein [Longimicrobium sp.]